MATPVHLPSGRFKMTIPPPEFAGRAFPLVTSSIPITRVPGACLRQTSSHILEDLSNNGKATFPPADGIFSSIPPPRPAPSYFSIPSTIRTALPPSPARCPCSSLRAKSLALRFGPLPHPPCCPTTSQPSNVTRDENRCRGTSTPGQSHERNHHLDHKEDTEYGGKHLQRIHDAIVVAIMMSAVMPQGQEKAMAGFSLVDGMQRLFQGACLVNSMDGHFNLGPQVAMLPASFTPFQHSTPVKMDLRVLERDRRLRPANDDTHNCPDEHRNPGPSITEPPCPDSAVGVRGSGRLSAAPPRLPSPAPSRLHRCHLLLI